MTSEVLSIIFKIDKWVKKVENVDLYSDDIACIINNINFKKEFLFFFPAQK